MAVYLLHSSAWIGGTGRNGARHYVGYIDDAPGALEARLRLHRAGRSDVAIVRAFLAAGGTLYLGNFWPFLTRNDERHVKDYGHYHQLCQVCGALAEAEVDPTKTPKERTWTPKRPHWTTQRIEQSIKRANSGDTIW